MAPQGSGAPRVGSSVLPPRPAWPGDPWEQAHKQQGLWGPGAPVTGEESTFPRQLTPTGPLRP